MNGKLHVRAARVDADRAKHRNRSVAHRLVFLVGESLRRRDRDGVARVHAHRVQVFDRADDDGVVGLVTHDLHLVLLPAEERLFNEHFVRGRKFEPAGHDRDEFLHVVGNAAPGAPEREARADDGRKAHRLQHGKRLLERVRRTRARAFEPDFRHERLEALAVFGLVDRFGARADQLDAVLGKDALARERHGAVERGLAAHRRQDRIGALFFNDARHRLPGDRLDVRRVGRLRIRHDGGGIGVDENRAVALFAENAAGLNARIVEFARLPDHDGAGADDENGLDVCTLGHDVSNVLCWRSRTGLRPRPPRSSFPVRLRARGRTSRRVRRCRADRGSLPGVPGSRRRAHP